MMIDPKDLNNNIISNRYEARYDNLPNDIKEKLDQLDTADVSEFQLQVIKRKRVYPQIGDVFIVKPKEDITFYGVVINHHINNINGEDLLLVLIFKDKVRITDSFKNGIKNSDLLIPPQIVGKEYWTRGYFYNVDHYNETINIDKYGFYSILDGKFFDEYGKKIKKEPPILGIYGVSTIIGVGLEITQELIIAGLI